MLFNPEKRQAMEQVAQRCCITSFYGDFQESVGKSPQLLGLISVLTFLCTWGHTWHLLRSLPAWIIPVTLIQNTLPMCMREMQRIHENEHHWQCQNRVRIWALVFLIFHLLCTEQLRIKVNANIYTYYLSSSSDELHKKIDSWNP